MQSVAVVSVLLFLITILCLILEYLIGSARYLPSLERHQARLNMKRAGHSSVSQGSFSTVSWRDWRRGREAMNRSTPLPPYSSMQCPVTQGQHQELPRYESLQVRNRRIAGNG